MGGIFPNALIVARREYLTRVRTRTFVLLTAVLTIVGVVLVLLPTWLTALVGDDREDASIAVTSDVDDLPSEPTSALSLQLNSFLGMPGVTAGPDRFRVEAATDAEAARRDVTEGRLDGLLTITRNDDGDLEFDYFTEASAGGLDATLVRQAASVLAIQDRLSRAGVAPSEQPRIFAPAAFDMTPVDPDADSGDEPTPQEFAGRFLLAPALIVIMFVSIITYGQWVATSVGEEKTSRVMELLIGAASPIQLLTGKVLGAGGAGLTQYLAILIPASIALVLQGGGSALFGTGGEEGGAGLSLPLLLAFGAFFMLGFALYASLYAAAGSMVSRQEEVQQVIMPMMFLATGGYMVSYFAMTQIDEGWVRILSYVPFFSPYLMITRLVIGQVQPYEVVLAVALLLIGTAVMFWVAARVYRAGVLLYGQRPGVRTVFQALRAGR